MKKSAEPDEQDDTEHINGKCRYDISDRVHGYDSSKNRAGERAVFGE